MPEPSGLFVFLVFTPERVVTANMAYQRGGNSSSDFHRAVWLSLDRLDEETFRAR